MPVLSPDGCRCSYEEASFWYRDGSYQEPGEDKYAILSDILGDEDHLGDMDFKTTGTRDGLTATQMDIKCDGLSFEILEEALMQAKAGREHILNCMMETISEHVLR